MKVSLEDNGVGIGAEQQANIFDPFFTTKDAGTGLGLTLSLGIVESHGGSMEVLSARGKGTTIIIKLPFRPVEDSQGETPVA